MIQSVKWVNREHTFLLVDGMFVPWPTDNWCRAEIEEWLLTHTPEPHETPAEQAAREARELENAAVDVLEGENRSDAVFAALRNATAEEMNTFINNTFPAMTVQQRAVLKLLLRFTALRLRRG